MTSPKTVGWKKTFFHSFFSFFLNLLKYNFSEKYCKSPHYGIDDFDEEEDA